MGCDIHSFMERKAGDRYEVVKGDGFEPFGNRTYAAFGFLAGVRNYSAVAPISTQRGFPDDASGPVRSEFEGWGVDAHSPSWLSVDELSSFDYDQMTEDRRCTRVMPGGWRDGGQTADEGEGKAMTYREFLGPFFFRDIETLRELGADRIVFWFDN